MKSEIVERLGQHELLLPSLIAEGLRANDRVKARLSILQAAINRARTPTACLFDLTEECRAARLDHVAMEALVAGASLDNTGQITSPGLGGLGMEIWDDIACMIRPVKAADTAQGDLATQRLAGVRRSVDWGSSDTAALAALSDLSRLTSGSGDSLHRLVMDLHKMLNRLSAESAEEVIAGAHVYGLLPEDRPAVTAFARGVQSTERLKFGHPGLATVATRSASRLTIQNDIGETDAHVVVIAIEQNTVTVTYSDVHPARARFFTRMLRGFPVQWSNLDRRDARGLGDDGTFLLVTGRYQADSGAARDAFLESLGASLVFLIDWNKARKVLRQWMAKGDAVRVLEWAAQNRLGHRGFLELGGAELVTSAIRHTAPGRIGFGERLERALGRDAAVDFVKTVLRVSAEALLQGSSVRLARDRIEAEIVRHLQRVDGTLLAIVARQAGLAREIASGIADCVCDQRALRCFDGAELATRARRIEEKADSIAFEARREIARLEASPKIELLVNRIEDAIDELEQAAFIASLVPGGVASDLLDPLAELCDAAVSGAEAAASGVTAAIDVPEGHRVDSEAALAEVGQLIEAEHRADVAERTVTTVILRGEFDVKTALSVLELARAIERATDRLADFGHLLREHVLADLAA
jgi:uncharacterized protein Yka (UPF0111/DUF47 family)